MVVGAILVIALGQTIVFVRTGEVRLLRRFVRIVNTGELLDEPGPGFGVQPFYYD